MLGMDDVELRPHEADEPMDADPALPAVPPLDCPDL